MARSRYTSEMRNDRRCNAIELRIVVAGMPNENAVETTRLCHVIKPIETFSIVKKTIPQTRRTTSVTTRYHAPEHFIGQKIPR